ncbi:Os03g0630166 [Oryza sativa Japonica Group]|uniref:Os03g0630166 protein n=1 Tax=Oryza sativa subsp. japonica TaxID=39947 RepID=A0A0P0W0Y9_ORYSJ|nr:Os03g0630166 [Oryza sativa Japonica Group]
MAVGTAEAGTTAAGMAVAAEAPDPAALEADPAPPAAGSGELVAGAAELATTWRRQQGELVVGAPVAAATAVRGPRRQ